MSLLDRIRAWLASFVGRSDEAEPATTEAASEPALDPDGATETRVEAGSSDDAVQKLRDLQRDEPDDEE